MYAPGRGPLFPGPLAEPALLPTLPNPQQVLCSHSNDPKPVPSHPWGWPSSLGMSHTHGCCPGLGSAGVLLLPPFPPGHPLTPELLGWGVCHRASQLDTEMLHLATEFCVLLGPFWGKDLSQGSSTAHQVSSHSSRTRSCSHSAGGTLCQLCCFLPVHAVLALLSTTKRVRSTQADAQHTPQELCEQQSQYRTLLGATWGRGKPKDLHGQQQEPVSLVLQN